MNDFRDDVPTVPDADTIPFDHELEAAASELVEIDLTADDAEEPTPVTRENCPGCGGPLATPRLSDSVDYPRSADEAWRHWSKACVATEGNVWSFCPVVGVAWVPGRVRMDWERRARAPGSTPPGGVERRGLPPPSGSR